MPHHRGPSRRSLLAGFGMAAGAVPLSAGRPEAQESPRRLVVGRTGHRADPGDGASRPLIAYDGTVPGPLLRARRGELLRLALVNEMDEPTSFTWHGVRTDVRQGAAPPLEAVLPGATSEFAVTPRDAGTFLYRPALPGDGGRQMRDGLSGILVVDAPDRPSADREVILHLADSPLAGSATGEQPAARILVNGQTSLALAGRRNERLWLRVANATPARIMQIAIPDQTLTLVALDGQPCEPFRLDGGRMTLAPGQRAEAMWDVAGTPGADVPITVANFAGDTLAGALKIADEIPLRPEPVGPPEALPANPLAQTMDFRRAFRIDLGIEPRAEAGTVFNGRPDRVPGREPAFRVRRGTVVMAGLRNDTDRFHAVHLQGHPARLLDGLDDGWKPFFLDTVLAAPRSTSRIAFVAETPGRWLLAAQEINDARGPLVAWFEVT